MKNIAKFLKTYSAALVLIFSVGTAALTPAVASAASNAQTAVCSTLGAGNDCSKQSSNGVSLNGTLMAVVNVLSAIIGIAAVIVIIIAGMRFITANGDTNSVASARQTIIYAVVGLIVASLAQLLVHFVLTRL